MSKLEYTLLLFLFGNLILAQDPVTDAYGSVRVVSWVVGGQQRS